MQRLRPITSKPISTKAYAVSGAMAALLAIVLWMTVGSSKPTPATTQAPMTPTHTTAVPAPSTPAIKPADTSLLATTAQAGWHVIAYTYNHEQQARAKVMQLQQRHVGMQPQVFSPTGHAPYFVALGGTLDSSSAFALRNRARQSGLPRDTYARNF
jgi:hypothetical protein